MNNEINLDSIDDMCMLLDYINDFVDNKKVAFKMLKYILEMDDCALDRMNDLCHEINNIGDQDDDECEVDECEVDEDEDYVKWYCRYMNLPTACSRLNIPYDLCSSLKGQEEKKFYVAELYDIDNDYPVILVAKTRENLVDGITKLDRFMAVETMNKRIHEYCYDRNVYMRIPLAAFGKNSGRYNIYIDESRELLKLVDSTEEVPNV